MSMTEDQDQNRVVNHNAVQLDVNGNSSITAHQEKNDSSRERNDSAREKNDDHREKYGEYGNSREKNYNPREKYGNSCTSHQLASDSARDITMVSQRVLPYRPEVHRNHLVRIYPSDDQGSGQGEAGTQATFLMFSDTPALEASDITPILAEEKKYEHCCQTNYDDVILIEEDSSEEETKDNHVILIEDSNDEDPIEEPNVKEPTKEEPVEEEPSQEEPVEEEPSREEPVEEEPTKEEPVEEEPSQEETVEKKVIGEEPSQEEPVEKKVIEEEPSQEEPVEEEPSQEEPVEEEPSQEEPVEKKFIEEEPSQKEPVEEEPTNDTSSVQNEKRSCSQTIERSMQVTEEDLNQLKDEVLTEANSQGCEIQDDQLSAHAIPSKSGSQVDRPNPSVASNRKRPSRSKRPTGTAKSSKKAHVGDNQVSPDQVNPVSFHHLNHDPQSLGRSKRKRNVNRIKSSVVGKRKRSSQSKRATERGESSEKAPVGSNQVIGSPHQINPVEVNIDQVTVSHDQASLCRSKRKRNIVSYQRLDGLNSDASDAESQASDHLDEDFKLTEHFDQDEDDDSDESSISVVCQPKEASKRAKKTQGRLDKVCSSKNDSKSGEKPRKKNCNKPKPSGNAKVMAHRKKPQQSTKTYDLRNLTRHFPVGQRFEADHRRINELLYEDAKDPYPCPCGRVFRNKAECDSHLKSTKICHPQDAFHLLVQVDKSGKESNIVCGLFDLSSAETATWGVRGTPCSVKCKLCARMFADRSDGITHIGQAHFGSVYMMCESCESVLCGREEYARHVSRYHPGENLCSLCPCPCCLKKLRSEEDLREHLHQTHKDPFKCAKCGFAATSESSKLEHEICHTHPYGQCFNKCMVCGIMALERSIGEHMLSEHGQILPVDRKEDGKLLLIVRANETKVKCCFCKETMLLQELKKHRTEKLCPKVHEDGETKQWTCEVCSQNFHNFYSFRIHAATWHSDEVATSVNGSVKHSCTPATWPLIDNSQGIQCELCAAFITRTQKGPLYPQHIQRYHLPSKEITSACDYCFHEIPVRVMPFHVKKHHGAKPMKSNFPEIARVYDSKLAFTADLRAALVKKPSDEEMYYGCDVCGDRFEDRDCLQQHIPDLLTQTLQHPQHLFHLIKHVVKGEEKPAISPFVSLLRTDSSNYHNQDMVKAHEKPQSANHQQKDVVKGHEKPLVSHSKANFSNNAQVGKESAGSAQAPDNSFQCTVCDKAFISAGAAVVHVGRVHLESGAYTYCFPCGLVFATQDALATHSAQFHRGKQGEGDDDQGSDTATAATGTNAPSTTTVPPSAVACPRCRHVSATRKEHLLHAFCHDADAYIRERTRLEQCPVCGKVMQYEELGCHMLESHAKPLKTSRAPLHLPIHRALEKRPKPLTSTTTPPRPPPDHAIDNPPKPLTTTTTPHPPPARTLLLQCSFCEQEDFTLQELFAHRANLLCPAVVKGVGSVCCWMCKKCERDVGTYHEWLLHAALEHTDPCYVLTAAAASGPQESAGKNEVSGRSAGHVGFELGAEAPVIPPRSTLSDAESSVASLKSDPCQWPVIWPDCSLVCPICGVNKEHYSAARRETHIRSHIDSNEVICEHCGVMCTIRSVQKHIYNKHLRKESDLVVCKTCGVKTDKSDLKRHEKTHHGLHKKKCPYCNEYFSLLTQHVLQKHRDGNALKKLYKCPECNWEKFCGASVYHHHKQRRHKNVLYECSVCGKTFGNQTAKYIHERTHAERKFVCDLCGKKFHQKCSLTRHILSHTNEKRYPCPWCSAMYSQSYPLSKHIEARHPDKYQDFVQKDVRRLKRK